MITQLSKKEIQKFIQDHLYDDPALLMLKAANHPDIPMREAVEQIQSKRKAKQKLPDWFATEGIVYPPVLSLEQCSSERTALYKASLVQGQTMIDLTGGMGIDTFYLSRSFEETHYVERQMHLVELAKHNFQRLDANSIESHHDQAESFLKSLAKRVDLIYLDPARRGAQNSKVVRFEDCEPNVIELLPELRRHSESILIKASPMLDIKGAINDLGEVTAVHVIADRNEVKELLFFIDENASVNPEVHTINLRPEGEWRFSFDYERESGLLTQFGTVSDFIYEPNAAILKAGAFKSIGEQFPSMAKLHANTHLYTSDGLIENFPGRVFQVLDTLQMNKKQLRRKLPEMRANISVRNFPMSVEQIRKKTGLKGGGEDYVFGLTDTEGVKFCLLKKNPDYGQGA
ncbi:MAG: SAM-dependent methyltransferase [Roseivirga sp.]